METQENTFFGPDAA